MKKIAVILFVFFIIGFCAIAIPIGFKLDIAKYNTEMTSHLASCAGGRSATSESNGVWVSMTAANTGSFAEALTRYELKRSVFIPDYDKTQAINVTFPDGAEFTVFEKDSAADKAYIIYRYHGKKRCYTLTGYNTLERVRLCTGPEGYTEENSFLN